MSVYVDPAGLPYRGRMYCHVWADSLHELHLAAAKVGLKREWFQEPPKASWRHYDCAPRMRSLLVAHGAIETDRFGPAEHEAKRRGDTAMLARISNSRALRAPAVPEPEQAGDASDARIHLCLCGAWGSFGFRQAGHVQWFCLEHSDHGTMRSAA